MQGAGEAWGPRQFKIMAAVVFTVVAICSTVAIATGAVGGSDSTPSGDHTPGGGHAPVIPHRPGLADESLPCTGPKEPVNFETFSAGPSAAGLPLTATVRRCDAAALPHEAANYVSYIYGECDIADCAPSVQIQTWPACQRSMAEYSFEGRPLPHRRLAKRDAAEVVEFDFAIDRRVEVYTKSATIVIFASDPDLARKTVGLLRPLQKGKPPVNNAAALGEGPPQRLGPPTDGSMEGVLPCES